MRIALSLVAGILFTTIAAGQAAYSDSLRAYQYNYKKDLFEIIKQDTGFIRFYPIDPAYHVTATVERLRNQPLFAMATSSGVSKQAIRMVLVKFTLHNKTYQLYGYQLAAFLSIAEQKDNFFIPFTDATTGNTSYSGGRYIDFAASDIQPNNTLAIDFNRAYNPYCAFVSGYNCPVPPKENDLPAAVKAGEMAFGKKSH